MNIAVGQKLWFVPTVRYMMEGEVEVTKVGRKWAEVAAGGPRVNIETMWADGAGYSSPGRYWPSREAYESEKERCSQWRELRDLIARHYQPPKHITTGEIVAAIALIGPPK